MARRLVLHFWSIQGLFRIVFNENPFIFITEMRKLLCTGLPMYLSVGVRIGVSAAGVSIGVSLRFFFYFSISSFPQNSFALPFLAGVALVILLASANISMCERRQHQHASSPCLCSAYVCVCVHRCVCVADFY